MKCFFICFALALAARTVSGAIPFIDDFPSGGPNAAWVQTAPTPGTLTCVANGTKSIPASSVSSDGFYGRMAYTGGGEQKFLAGDASDANYTISVRFYILTALPAPLNQNIYFYDGGATGGVVKISFGSIVLSINNSAYTKSWPLFAALPEGWSQFQLKLSGTTAQMFVNGSQLTGSADWTSAAPAVSSGKFGIGQSTVMTNVATAVDEFRVTGNTTGVEDWQLLQ